ncbi:phage holin [Sinobaca sp. H24]|uniref:phage holin n=1 Tax=Sinobaca sp. H24 TaxID=2923376 RepID=UPI0035B1132E
MLQLVSSQILGFEIGQDTVDATVDLVSAGLVTWAMWKNNYLGSKGKKQEQALKANHLK